jgi:EAL domain-containing protein (putative c-di-GMP-specific phosphodiesterase class I)
MTIRDTEVLVVDDEELLRKLLLRFLSRDGLRVHAASGGEEALAMMRGGRRFDTIVSDLMMPGMDGMQFLREIRQLDLDVPIVFLTGNPSLASAMEAMQHGGYRYLEKPIDGDSLVAVVRDAAAHHRLALLKRKALEVCEAGGWLIEDLDDLGERFERALGKLWMAYQPIVAWPSQRVFAHEALLRSSEPDLSSAPKLLDAAERLGRVQELGKLVRNSVAEELAAAGPQTVACVNLHALDLTSEHLFDRAAPLSRVARRVVLEISERAGVYRVEDLPGKIGYLRDLGFRVALDDLGGHVGLSTFRQLHPDLVKLDISLIRDVDSAPAKAHLIASMIQLCTRDLGMRVVCEGVETEGERDTLVKAGAELLQGYIFGRPARALGAVTSLASAS